MTDTPRSEDELPAFEDQDFAPPSYITLARIYDLLAVIALKLDPEQAEEILELHEHGHVRGAPPMWAGEE